MSVPVKGVSRVRAMLERMNAPEEKAARTATWDALDHTLASRDRTGFAYPASQGTDLAAQAFAKRNAKFAPLNEQMIGDWARQNGGKAFGAAVGVGGLGAAALGGGQGNADAGILSDLGAGLRAGARTGANDRGLLSRLGATLSDGRARSLNMTRPDPFSPVVNDNGGRPMFATTPEEDARHFGLDAPNLSHVPLTPEEQDWLRRKQGGSPTAPATAKSTAASRWGVDDPVAKGLLLGGAGLGAAALGGGQGDADAGAFTKVLGEGGDALRFHYGVDAPPVYPKGTGYAGMVTENDWRGSGMGEITARKAPGKRLYIDGSQLDPNLIGQGHGIRMYSAFADWAHANGYKVFSDSLLSEDSRHIYPALSRRGYDIRNVSRKVEATPDQTGIAKDDQAIFPVGAMDSRPIYKIGPKTGAQSGARFYAAPLALGGTTALAAALGGGQGDADAGILAYHGSPHLFDKFDMSKIGTGEGAQAFGHGLYFAGNEGVARGYRDALTKGIGADATPDRLARAYLHDQNGDLPATVASLEKIVANKGLNPLLISRATDALGYLKANGAPDMSGHMYQVNLDVDPSHLLDWDKPLAEQPLVDARLAGVPRENRGHGKDAWFYLNDRARGGNRGYADPKESDAKGLETARMLSRQGIPGIQYLDAGSRSAGDGTRNYVMFDHNKINILRRYGVAGALGGTTALAAALTDPGNQAIAEQVGAPGQQGPAISRHDLSAALEQNLQPGAQFAPVIGNVAGAANAAGNGDFIGAARGVAQGAIAGLPWLQARMTAPRNLLGDAADVADPTGIGVGLARNYIDQHRYGNIVTSDVTRPGDDPAWQDAFARAYEARMKPKHVALGDALTRK